MIEIIRSVNPVTSSSHVLTNFFRQFFSSFFRPPQFNPIEVKIAANTPTMIMIATQIMLSLMIQFYVLEVQLKKLVFVLEIPEVL